MYLGNQVGFHHVVEGHSPAQILGFWKMSIREQFYNFIGLPD